MAATRRRREVPRPELRCPSCAAEVEQFWYHCANCGRRLHWRDLQRITNAECRYCGWLVSDSYSFCPWCGRDITDRDSSPEPLKRPKGFKFERRCRRCSGGLMYPMQFCPWCGRGQRWPYREYQNVCPHCDRGVDDWMHTCPWCGEDATGRDLIRQGLARARGFLVAARIKVWHYRILLRPGVSGVSHLAPKVIEIERRYVTVKRRRDEISWNMLTGLILHELGHSFLYHHWSWTRTGRFRRAFGEVRKVYRVADEHWVDFERRRVTTTLPNFVTAYAATHPQEDFAETFRIYVSRRGRLRELFTEFGRKRKGVILFEKFLVLHDFVRSLRGWQ
ncbi:MAG TPA: putative zinc-binding metallopeptidase [Gemmatimonadales bacterium]|nr:putative zinc-binding metallopeptidase [Gemmatimonadales bacterium]